VLKFHQGVNDKPFSERLESDALALARMTLGGAKDARLEGVLAASASQIKIAEDRWEIAKALVKLAGDPVTPADFRSRLRAIEGDFHKTQIDVEKIAVQITDLAPAERGQF
jgi:hypothetical protein